MQDNLNNSALLNLRDMFVKLIKFEISSIVYIFISIILSCFCYFLIFENLLPSVMPVNFQSEMDLDYGDGPGYLNFDFTSFEIIFSQHRSFGLPLIIEFYKLFDTNFVFWPKFNYLVFCISIIFLFICLSKSNFSRCFSFFFTISILLSYNLYLFLYFWTEIFSISFLNITIGIFFLSLKTNNKLLFFLFGFFLFYTYQIRPSFLTFIIIPPLFVTICSIIEKKNYFLLKTYLFSFLPFITFLIIKLVITGYLSFVPFSGAQMAGHGMYYIDELNIKSLSNKNILFANNLLERKKNLEYPCNLTRSQALEKKIDPIKHRYECWNYYFISSWLEKIKFHKKIEPFNDYEKNKEPWKHIKSLELFFLEAGNNNKIDKELSGFAIEVYKNNIFNQIEWVLDSTKAGLKIYLPRVKYLFILFFIIIIFYLFLSLSINRKIILNINRNEIYFLFCLMCYQLLNFLLFSLVHVPDQRTMSIQYYLTIPIILSFLTALLKYRKN